MRGFRYIKLQIAPGREFTGVSGPGAGSGFTPLTGRRAVVSAFGNNPSRKLSDDDHDGGTSTTTQIKCQPRKRWCQTPPRQTAAATAAAGDALRNLLAQPRRKAGLEYHSRHLVGTDQIDIRHIDIADITRRSAAFERTVLSDKKLATALRVLPQDATGVFKDSYDAKIRALCDGTRKAQIAAVDSHRLRKPLPLHPRSLRLYATCSAWQAQLKAPVPLPKDFGRKALVNLDELSPINIKRQRDAQNERPFICNQPRSRRLRGYQFQKGCSCIPRS
jgi:hypothetical protein